MTRKKKISLIIAASALILILGISFSIFKKQKNSETTEQDPQNQSLDPLAQTNPETARHTEEESFNEEESQLETTNNADLELETAENETDDEVEEASDNEEEESTDDSDADTDDESFSTILYVSESCPDCDEVINFIKKNNLSEDLENQTKLVKNNTQNYREWLERGAACELERVEMRLPMLWIEGECYVGRDEIIDFLEEELL